MSAAIFLFPLAKSDNQIAEEHIRDELVGYPKEVVAEAVSRADRLIRAQLGWKPAMDRAIKWARCAIHDNEPPSAA